MELLEKTRKINKLLQRGEKVEYNAIARLLRDVIGANIYIVGRKGGVKGSALQDDFECDIMREQVLDVKNFSQKYLDFIMDAKETVSNIEHKNQECSFVKGTKCFFDQKKTTIVPIYGNGERIGTLIVAKYDKPFDDEDLLLAEYAATVIGVEILHERAAKVEEEVRKKAMVQIAFSTLSYSELEAIVNILGELKGMEGLLVASKIADRVGITRSVIVNALRKFESAGLIETKSLGMKGTYIRIKNEFLLEDDFSLLLQYCLLNETPESLISYTDMSKDLAARICNQINHFENFTQFTELLKTKELTYTRIQRALLHTILKIREQPKGIPYARVLGFRKSSSPLLKEIKQYTTIPVITKAADASGILSADGQKIWNDNLRASNIYESILAQKTGRPFVHEYQKQLVLL